MQVLAHSRSPMPMRPGSVRKEDYEYERRGTVNLFVAVEPKAGLRTVAVTDRRTKADSLHALALQNLCRESHLPFGGQSQQHFLPHYKNKK